MYCYKGLLATLILLSMSLIAEAKVSADTNTHAIATVHQLNSKILSEPREIMISLPEDYNATSTTYPVHILLDGEQNIEHAVASSRMLAKWAGLPQAIIVGIASTNRVRDFTPSRDSNYSPDSGGASKFAQFIEKEVMTFVDGHYRTHPYRILTGHSLGGLFGATQLLENNSFFSAFILIAPALWWNNFSIFERIDTLEDTTFLANYPVFLGIGEKDGDGMKQELMRFYTELKKKYKDKQTVKYKAYPEEGHMSAPLKVFYDGTKHVFAAAIYDDTRWPSFTFESFSNFDEDVKHRFGSSVKQTGELYVTLSNFLMQRQNYSGAIAVLLENINAYPNYPPNYALLANAYVFSGESDLAKSTYARAAEHALRSNSFGAGVSQQYTNEIKKINDIVQLSEKTLSKLVGCYKAESGSTFTFVIQDSQLFGKREGWTEFKLFALDDAKFVTRLEPIITYRFSEDSVEAMANGTAYVFTKAMCDH